MWLSGVLVARTRKPQSLIEVRNYKLQRKRKAPKRSPQYYRYQPPGLSPASTSTFGPEIGQLTSRLFLHVYVPVIVTSTSSSRQISG